MKILERMEMLRRATAKPGAPRVEQFVPDQQRLMMDAMDIENEATRQELLALRDRVTRLERKLGVGQAE